MPTTLMITLNLKQERKREGERVREREKTKAQSEPAYKSLQKGRQDKQIDPQLRWLALFIHPHLNFSVLMVLVNVFPHGASLFSSSSARLSNCGDRCSHVQAPPCGSRCKRVHPQLPLQTIDYQAFCRHACNAVADPPPSLHGDSVVAIQLSHTLGDHKPPRLKGGASCSYRSCLSLIIQSRYNDTNFVNWTS